MIKTHLLRRPNRFENPIVFSDGIGSAGKRMLGHILASFDGIEKMSHHFVFDYVADLHWLGKISDDGAVTYLQTEADLQSYQLMLARDQNFRPGDTTSVWSNPRPLRYLARLLRREGDQVALSIARKKPWLHEAPHDGLRQASLYFSAFEDRLRIVHIVRDPRDLTLDLLLRGFGWRVGADPREFQFVIEQGENIVPIAFKDLSLDFSSLSNADVVALTVAESMRQNFEGYSSLKKSNKDRVKIVFFDDFCRRPQWIVSELSSFLGVRTTISTRSAIRRENLPRAIQRLELQNADLLAQLSDVGMTALDQATAIYENVRRTFS